MGRASVPLELHTSRLSSRTPPALHLTRRDGRGASQACERAAMRAAAWCSRSQAMRAQKSADLLATTHATASGHAPRARDDSAAQCCQHCGCAKHSSASAPASASVAALRKCRAFGAARPLRCKPSASFCIINYFEMHLSSALSMLARRRFKTPELTQSLLMRFVCFHSSRDCWKTFMVAWLNSWLWMQ